MSEASKVAESFGVGMTVSDGEVMVLLVVTVDGEQVYVPLEDDDITNLTGTLFRMSEEARLVREAVATMPPEAAKAYVENWVAREQSPLN